MFTTRYGTQLDAGDVRRAFRRILRRAGLDADKATPRELRHSFVSLLSNHGGLSLEEISRLVGHATTTVTQKVYRQELRPMLIEGADAIDRLLAQRTTTDRLIDRLIKPVNIEPGCSDRAVRL